MKVYILSDGERFEGEHIVAVYGEWLDAFEALNLRKFEHPDAELTVRGETVILESDVFYTIIRTQEVL